MFSNPTSRQINIALIVLRVTLGIIFIAHGGQKIFVYGLEGVAGSFGQMGIPMAALAGPAVALLEFFGGIALVLGLLTRLASLGLVVDMLGAIMFVHLKAGFFAPQGYEFVLMLAGAALALTITGAGAYSIDGWIAAREAGRRTQLSSVRGGTQRAA
jgi:putative oxidoreductase